MTECEISTSQMTLKIIKQNQPDLGKELNGSLDHS